MHAQWRHCTTDVYGSIFSALKVGVAWRSVVFYHRNVYDKVTSSGKRQKLVGFPSYINIESIKCIYHHVLPVNVRVDETRSYVHVHCHVVEL